MPAFTAAIEAHQRRITEAIIEHALKIFSEKKVRAYLGFKASCFTDKFFKTWFNLRI